MAITFRHYTRQAGITEDYYRVRAFFIELGYAEYTYARWDWMTTHSSLDRSALDRIGIWTEDDRMVALVTFDTRLGTAFCLTLPGHRSLLGEMLEYAKDAIGPDVVIPDTDADFQAAAARAGYVATEDREHDAVFHTSQTSTECELPPGFSITTLQDRFDLAQYRRVLWKGFNHELKGEGAFAFSRQAEEAARAEMIRPHVDLDLKVAVVSPEGHFVAYCGMWYDQAAGFAVIEPVATDPDFRRMGLGKAAVLEGIRRVRERGAELVTVGSSQQFYYSIGMRPYTSSTIWKRREAFASIRSGDNA